jgi:hypothetical protein
MRKPGVGIGGRERPAGAGARRGQAKAPGGPVGSEFAQWGQFGSSADGSRHRDGAGIPVGCKRASPWRRLNRPNWLRFSPPPTSARPTGGATGTQSSYHTNFVLKKVRNWWAEPMKRTDEYWRAYEKWKTLGPMSGFDASKRPRSDEIHERRCAIFRERLRGRCSR